MYNSDLFTFTANLKVFIKSFSVLITNISGLTILFYVFYIFYIIKLKLNFNIIKINFIKK